LRLVEMDKLSGYWRGSMFRVAGDTLKAAGKNDQAAEAYREVIKESAASAADRKAAEEGISK